MNRDWIALSQPETRGKIAAFLEWYPQVYVDLHEMGANSTYYFPPPAEPINPQFTPDQMQWLEAFGRNNAVWFDRFGIDYFTREVFDAFYPGYGEGWPTFHGAIGMTYEQASVRGLLVERDDETELTYRDSVRHHFVASLATVQTAARDREALLRSFYDYRRSAAETVGEDGAVEYLLPPGADPQRTAELAGLLMAQGIEVEVADEAFRVSGALSHAEEEPEDVDLPAGTYVVSLRQPAARLARTLMARHQQIDPEFLAEQERRRVKRLSIQFYDVTAWSLPLLFDVECYATKTPSGVSSRVLEQPPVVAGRAPAQPAALAYLVRWGTRSAARALAEMLRRELRVFATDKEFVLGGATYPPGSLVVKVKNNPEDLHATLTSIAEETGVEIAGTDTAWVEDGVGLGSNQVRYLKVPRVALAYGRPTSSYSTGWARYVLEQEFGYPVTILNVRQIGGADLSKYDVLILPGGRYGSALAGATDSLKAWIRAGGTLVTLGSATQWLTGESVGLLATKREDRKKGKPQKAEGETEEATESAEDTESEAAEAEGGEEPAFDYDEAIQPDKESPDRTPGAILRIELDPEHWLGFGYDGGTNVLVDSRNIFTPIKLDKGRNVGVYAGGDAMVRSGFIWAPSSEQLAQKAYLVHQPHGRGHVVAFAEDPNYRAFCHGLNLMFLNAVFFGPAH